MSWKRGQETYEKFMDNIMNDVRIWYEDKEWKGEARLYNYTRAIIPDMIANLRVKDLIQIHEYLMYRAEIVPDPRVPTYVYSGGDRVTSVSRYILKHIDLELAKQYA